MRAIGLAGVAVGLACTLAACGGGGSGSGSLGSVGTAGLQTLGTQSATAGAAGTTTNSSNSPASSSGSNANGASSAGTSGGTATGSTSGTGSNGSTGSTDSGTTIPPLTAFAIAGNSTSFGSFTNAEPAPSQSIDGRIFYWNSGWSGNPGKHIAYDAAHDSLYATYGFYVVVFAHASTQVDGMTVPTRIIQPSGGAYGLSSYLLLDTATDTLWLGGQQTPGGGVVMKFSHASTLDAIVTPDAVYPMNGDMSSLAIDKQRSLLYAYEGSQIGVYDMTTLKQAADLAANQVNVAQRELSQGGFDIALDVAHDRLYSTNGTDSLYVTTGSSVATTTGPSATIGLLQPMGLAYDAANDRLWVGEGFSHAYIFDHAGSLTVGSTFTVEALFQVINNINGSFPIWGISLPS